MGLRIRFIPTYFYMEAIYLFRLMSERWKQTKCSNIDKVYLQSLSHFGRNALPMKAIIIMLCILISSFQTQEPKTRLNHPLCCCGCCFPEFDGFLPLDPLPFPFMLPLGAGGGPPFHTGICVAFHIGWGPEFHIGGYGRTSTADDRRLKRPPGR